MDLPEGDRKNRAFDSCLTRPLLTRSSCLVAPCLPGSLCYIPVVSSSFAPSRSSRVFAHTRSSPHAPTLHVFARCSSPCSSPLTQPAGLASLTPLSQNRIQTKNINTDPLKASHRQFGVLALVIVFLFQQTTSDNKTNKNGRPNSYGER